jgi:hypothetical protein
MARRKKKIGLSERRWFLTAALPYFSGHSQCPEQQNDVCNDCGSTLQATVRFSFKPNSQSIDRDAALTVLGHDDDDGSAR